ncbi:MAG: ABC transporter permease [Planctomycetota bacterium]
MTNSNSQPATPTSSNPTQPPRPVRGPWRTLFLRLKKNRIAVVGGWILIVLYGLSCFAGFLSPSNYTDGDSQLSLYGPMLFGGYHIIDAVDIETDADGNEIEVPRVLVFEDEYGEEFEEAEKTREWRHFSGGITFTDPEGNFTFRPHVYALQEVISYDEYGEEKYLVGIDPDVRLPIQFFVQSEEEHELASLCGWFRIFGTTHLFGVRAPKDDERFTNGDHVARVFLLGSDKSGRDLFTRILYGGQISLSVGLIGIVISMGIGLIIGGISGYFGGWIDVGLMRFTELLMAIPGLYLILTLRNVFIQDSMDSRETYLWIVVILALAGWAATGRVIRGMVLSLKEQEYALSARALGAGHTRVILRHILPNTASFVIVTATLYVPYYILGEVALSFLGLGITEPEASWGLLLKDAQSSEILKYSPWIVIPGLFIFIAVLAYNFLGDGLRDAADPRAVLGKKG